MALSANIVWEVRTGGSDTNGGGFKTGASGTDWSQQTSPQYSVTDAVANGTTTVTSATAAFGTDVVGNIAYINGAWYEIISRTNATTIVVDRTISSASGLTLKIGGCLASIQTVTNGVMVAGNIVWVQAGTYTVSSTVGVNGQNSLPNSQPSFVLGYNATRGDNPTGSSRPVITTASAITLVTIKSVPIYFANFILDGANTATTGLMHDSSVGNSDRGTFVANVRVTACATRGINVGSFASVVCCEVDTMKTGATSAFGSCFNCVNCYAHDNPCAGFSLEGNNAIAFWVGCISETNTGSNGYGFRLDHCLTNSFVERCVAYNNAQDGFYGAGTYTAYTIRNCIADSNGRYGFNGAHDLNKAARLDFGWNATRNNTSGARNVLSAGTGDVALTADPFTNAAAGDFSLNNTAGGGAALRAAGFPGAFPGGTTTGYLDIGAVQHQDSGGGSAGMLFIPNLAGT